MVPRQIPPATAVVRHVAVGVILVCRVVQLHQLVTFVSVCEVILRCCNIRSKALEGKDVAVAVEREVPLGVFVRLAAAVVTQVINQASRTIVIVLVRYDCSIVSPLVRDLADEAISLEGDSGTHHFVFCESDLLHIARIVVLYTVKLHEERGGYIDTKIRISFYRKPYR